MKPIRRARYSVLRLSPIRAMLTPSIRTSPPSNASRPLTQLRKVVLPQPDGPMIATISPRRTARSTPLRASSSTPPVR